MLLLTITWLIMLHESSIICLVPAVPSDFTARKLLSEGLVLSWLMKSKERIQNQCFDTAQPRLCQLQLKNAQSVFQGLLG